MFTSWLLFYFALTVDGSTVGDDELEAVLAYSRYYLSSWLDRGKKNQENLMTICPRTQIRTRSLPNTDILVNPHTGFAQHRHKLQLAFPQRSALSERVSSYEYTKSYGVRCSTVEAKTAWSYAGRSCWSSPIGGSTVKNLF
jgi:hypothetical protein